MPQTNHWLWPYLIWAGFGAIRQLPFYELLSFHFSGGWISNRMGPRWWPSQLGHLELMMWSNLKEIKCHRKCPWHCMQLFACVRDTCLDLCHNMEITSWTSMMMCFVCIPHLIFQWYIIIPTFLMRKLWLRKAVQSFQSRTDNVGFTSKFSNTKFHSFFFSCLFIYIMYVNVRNSDVYIEYLSTWIVYRNLEISGSICKLTN